MSCFLCRSISFSRRCWLTPSPLRSGSRGLIAFFVSARFKPYRALGWCYLVCFTVFFVLHGKNYYLAPIYPMLLAAGAVVIESMIDGRKLKTAEVAPSKPRSSRLAWLKPVIVTLLLASGAHLAPVVVPILSPDAFLAYVKYLADEAAGDGAQPRAGGFCRSGTPISLAGKKSWRRRPRPITNSRPQSGQAAGSLRRIMDRPARSIFLARVIGLPPALSGHQTY